MRIKKKFSFPFFVLNKKSCTFVINLKIKQMIEFKIQVEEDIVKEYGHNILEKYLQEYLTKAILKLTAKEILEDLKTIDCEDDRFIQARERAWNKYGKHTFLNVTANV